MPQKRSNTSTTEKNTKKSKTIDKRSYNSQTYWNDRYIYYLNKTEEKKDDIKQTDIKTKSKKIKQSKNEPDHEDVTSEWYYSYNDIEPLIESGLKRFKNKDMKILDVGNE
jgi:hypothetical protein